MSKKQSFIEDDEAVRQAYISAPISQDDLDGLQHVLDEARATDDEMAPVHITQEGAEKLLRQLPALLAAAKRCAEMEAALEPFARNPDAVSLSEVYGHLTREHARRAREVIERKPHD